MVLLSPLKFAAGAVLAIFVFAAAPANAGPQYVDASGFAVSGYDVVAYFDLKQAPVGSPQPKAVPGRANITAEYNGAKFAFSSEANRRRFLANPARFVPAYDGHCAYGVAKGSKVPANPHLWRIVDGQLYLNITKGVVKTWEQDISRNISRAQGNWPGIAGAPASTGKVPGFSPAAAPVSG